MVSNEELRAAMEFADTADPVDVELFESREAVGVIHTLAAAVRELYEALDDVIATDGRHEHMWELLDRYRAALEGGKDEDK